MTEVALDARLVRRRLEDPFTRRRLLFFVCHAPRFYRKMLKQMSLQKPQGSQGYYLVQRILSSGNFILLVLGCKYFHPPNETTSCWMKLEHRCDGTFQATITSHHYAGKPFVCHWNRRTKFWLWSTPVALKSFLCWPLLAEDDPSSGVQCWDCCHAHFFAHRRQLLCALAICSRKVFW